jgi:tetratricopeptide (TPR) repeat protein
MESANLFEPSIDNEENYDDLIVSIEASQNQLNLLIAVCDDTEYRDQIIQRYEAELTPEISCYQVKLARGEPSLKAAISALVEQKEPLQQRSLAVITVTGAEQLYFLRHGDERSEQEIFFGYLQWTREALRQFPFSIVLWITSQIEQKLSKQAPDFWSWRKGVFRFKSKRKKLVSADEFQPFREMFQPRFSEVDEDEPYFLPIEDLKALIQDLEQEKGTDDASLATLYARMGEIYKRRIEQGDCEDYQQEQTLAIEYFQKAISLQQKLNLEIELAESLNNLAELYYFQGRYSEAEPLFQQALEIRQRLFSGDHIDVAASLNNLAYLYLSKGRYAEAEPLYRQALEMRQRLFSGDHPDVASSLNNLAYLYNSQGRYSEAEPLYRQALEMTQRLFSGDYPDVASSLNNLGGLYHSQGRYAEAEPLYWQALAMYQRLFSGDYPDVASSLNNLGGLYHSQGRYAEAEPLYRQALEMRQRLFSGDHPDVASSLNNLAGLYLSKGRYAEAEPLYRQALEMRQRLFSGDHPDVASSLNNLAGLYLSQGRNADAEPLYRQALEMERRLFSGDHPDVAISLNNLAGLYESQGRNGEA